LLRSQSGLVIALDNYGKSELSVGRYDARTGKSPDIDLSEEPHGNTVSRAHAQLRQQGQQWVLVPLSNKSPTYVGNILLNPQQPRTLKPGDVITLGNLQLTFETGRP
jgi:pSer/pThr/pTyr-binding forkhead associated (FHA) protein